MHVACMNSIYATLHIGSYGLWRLYFTHMHAHARMPKHTYACIWKRNHDYYFVVFIIFYWEWRVHIRISLIFVRLSEIKLDNSFRAVCLCVSKDSALYSGLDAFGQWLIALNFSKHYLEALLRICLYLKALLRIYLNITVII